MRLAILSAGAPRHAQNLQKQLQSISDKNRWGWETAFWEWRKNGYDDYDFASVDWCWWEGCFERVFEFMLMQGGPRHICRWIGTDILQHRELVGRGYPDPFAACSIHLADAPHLGQEAKDLTGLDVSLVRSIPPETYSPTPITQWDNILCYVPTSREDFFHLDWILDVAADYPDITFNILARETIPKALDNVLCYQEVQGNDKRKLFERCFLFLRPVVHDGVSLTLIEMGQLGRYVAHSDPRIPHVRVGRSVGEIEFQLDRILERKESPNPEIADHYRREYSMEALEQDVTRLHERMDD